MPTRVPLDDFFPIPSLSTTFSSHRTRGPLLRSCAPVSVRMGPCGCACVWVSVREPEPGSVVRVARPPALPLAAGSEL